MLKANLFIFILIISVTGCSLVRKQIDKKSPEAGSSNMAGVESQLADAAKSIEHSLNTLAAVQESKSPPILNIAPLLTPEGGMGNTADIDWSGPIAPLLSKLADMTDYRLKTLGVEPPIPILVSISAKNVAIAEIVQNASLQAGKKANVLVFPSNRVIELRYESL